MIIDQENGCAICNACGLVYDGVVMDRFLRSSGGGDNEGKPIYLNNFKINHNDEKTDISAYVNKYLDDVFFCTFSLFFSDEGKNILRFNVRELFQKLAENVARDERWTKKAQELSACLLIIMRKYSKNFHKDIETMFLSSLGSKKSEKACKKNAMEIQRRIQGGGQHQEPKHPDHPLYFDSKHLRTSGIVDDGRDSASAKMKMLTSGLLKRKLDDDIRKVRNNGIDVSHARVASKTRKIASSIYDNHKGIAGKPLEDVRIISACVLVVCTDGGGNNGGGGHRGVVSNGEDFEDPDTERVQRMGRICKALDLSDVSYRSVSTFIGM